MAYARCYTAAGDEETRLYAPPLTPPPLVRCLKLWPGGGPQRAILTFEKVFRVLRNRANTQAGCRSFARQFHVRCELNTLACSARGSRPPPPPPPRPHPPLSPWSLREDASPKLFSKHQHETHLFFYETPKNYQHETTAKNFSVS